MKILLCFNENYAPHAAAVVTGLISHSSQKLSFAVLYTFMSQETISKFKSYYATKVDIFEFHKVDIDGDLAKKFMTIQSQDHLSGKIEPYLRLFAPIYLKDDEVIYLDCDIIIKGDICEMLNEIDRSYYVCGVNEHDPNHKMHDLSKLDKYTTPRSFEDYFYRDAFFYRLKKYYGMNDNSKYMNDGIMFMNLKKWREDDLLTKMIKKIDTTNLFYSADQDLVNSVIDGQYKSLSPKWNTIANYVGILSNYTTEQLEESNNNPYIIHTVGPNKAWLKGAKGDYIDEYWKCRKMSPWPYYNPQNSNMPTPCLIVKIYRRLLRIALNILTKLSEVGVKKSVHTFASVYSSDKIINR